MRLAQPIETKQWSWLRGVDLNHRPLGYEPNELPDCSTPQFDHNNGVWGRQTDTPRNEKATNTSLPKRRTAAHLRVALRHFQSQFVWMADLDSLNAKVRPSMPLPVYPLQISGIL